jgi:hypothetical protein
VKRMAEEEGTEESNDQWDVEEDDEEEIEI